MQFYFTADDMPSMDTSARTGMRWQLKCFTNSFSICVAFHLTWLCALIACGSHGASWKIYYHGSGFLRTRGTRRLYYYHSFFSLVLVWRLSSLFFSFILTPISVTWFRLTPISSTWFILRSISSTWFKGKPYVQVQQSLEIMIFFPANSVNLKSVLFYHL